MSIVPKVCRVCHNLFTPRTTSMIYCSKDCANESARARYRERNPALAPNASRLTAGVVSELLVTADLLGRGYEVYRASSPNSSCDMIAMRDGVMLRIEVRTGYRRSDGTLGVPSAVRDMNRFDVKAVVIRTGEIYYIPELEDEANIA